MSKNKNATIRYHALDKCFNNTRRKYTIDDLVEACNEALYEENEDTSGVKKRQVYEDIKFMESPRGWSVDLLKTKEGRRTFYRYEDSNFTIKSQGMNPNEMEQLKDTLSILSRFKGMPHFEWIEEIQIRLEDTFQLKSNANSFVSFEENPYLKGMNHFSDLFNAIQHEQTLEITYQGFNHKTPITAVYHPWYLKQYNNRWFLFAYNATYDNVSNLAIDRIQTTHVAQELYIPNEVIDFDEYFDGVIGVSVMKDQSEEKILIRIAAKSWPYIESKPLHGSQKVKQKTDEFVDVELSIQENHEFFALMFSHMDAFEILEPESLRSKYIEIAKSIFQKYI